METWDTAARRSRWRAMLDGLSAAVGVAAGVALEFLRRFSLGWYERREMRAAIAPEIHAAAVRLNFLLLAAIEDGVAEGDLVRRYLSPAPRLDTVARLWEENPAQVVKLPEGSRLRWLDGALRELEGDRRQESGDRRHAHHAETGERAAASSRVFRAIQIVEAMTLDPLRRTLPRRTLRFAEGIAGRPDVMRYRNEYMLRQRGAHGG